eukprot:jgi/Tetstr1/441572/TSEL_029801.t1
MHAERCLGPKLGTGGRTTAIRGRAPAGETVDGRTAGGDKPEHPPVLAKHRASRPVTTRGGRGRTRG